MSPLKPLSERTPDRRPAELPGRIEPLAKLPVFVSLRDRTAVVVGGSAAAAWKVELLAAAGAGVTVFAADLSAELRAVAENLPGKVTIHRRAWRDDDLAGTAMAVADVETEAEAACFAAAARRAGVPHNVIDKPAHCSIQFGAIVNRSPVVIGISTDGAAPVLGQAIRRRVETLLPAGLAAWAAAAQGFRAGLKSLLPSPERRRAFWRAFAELSFTEAPLGDLEARLRVLAGHHGAEGQGLPGVTLVGAGPGDAGLLTLNAVRALQSADVILFDDLVSDEVLDLARREARRLLVGKRGGRASCRQEEINALMVKLAKQGKRVVRLKAGDPMIFGRAGEEIAELEAAGIPVEVVPGITAALGAAARLGVSLTHRDCAQSLQLVTAHSRKGGLPKDVNWARLADPRSTVMFYMGARTGAEAAARLMAEGLAAETPVVILTAVSRPEEEVETLTLSELAARGEIAHEHPVLIGVGSVFAAVKAGTRAAPVLQARSA
ncbi:siroheme synthase CysG [Pelagibius marinus]|uniref:siroheme synthase CysG n=1 Tax=Pelagibius marinus TaxID=2762760 RepID=UPI0018726053|nr:siroheme synthase CysG [Pelagibius marinus]